MPNCKVSPFRQFSRSNFSPAARWLFCFFLLLVSLSADWTPTQARNQMAAEEFPAAPPATSTFIQAKRLTTLPHSNARGLGAAIAIDNDNAIVGAPYEHVTDGFGAAQGAAYLFTFKSDGRWHQAARLAAVDGGAADTFGSAVAIQSDTIAIGAPGADGPAGVSQGAVYIFVREGGGWRQQAKLTAGDDASANQTFGNSLALQAGTLIVGASGEGSGRGAAYVFTYSNGRAWERQAKLRGRGGNFGSACAFDGDTAIISAVNGSEGGGEVFVFTRDGANWTRRVRLTASDTAFGDRFGFSLAFARNTVFIGAPGVSQGATLNTGAAYVFSGVRANWYQQAKLVGSSGPNKGQTGAQFGYSVAYSSGRAVIGAPFTDVFPYGGTGRRQAQGAYYPFVLGEEGWTSLYRHELGLTRSAAGEQLGMAVALHNKGILDSAPGTGILAGAPGMTYEDLPQHGAIITTEFTSGSFAYLRKVIPGPGEQITSFAQQIAVDGDTMIVTGPGNGPGKAFVFVRQSSARTLQAKLLPADGQAGDMFGASVALKGNVAVIGAPGAAQRRGAVYVFVRNGSTWTQTAKLTAPTDPGNHLGYSVGLANNTIIAGAPFDNAGLVPGAAYIYQFDGGTWTPVVRLIAPDAQNADQFGYAVAADGETLLIGQPSFNQLSGAAYIFRRQNNTWTPAAQLRPLQNSQIANFGQAVALRGETALIGAPGSKMAYVYGLSNGNWSEQATLVGDSGKFGRAVALDDNMALVGSPTDVIGPAISRAFLFTRNGSQWTQETSLTNNDTQPFAHFGYTVALQNETAFIGASQQEVEPLAGIYGAVYIFQKQSVTSNRPPLIQARPLSDTRANGANGQVPLAVVSDPDQVAASLRVAVSPAALNGVAISDLEIDNAGVVRGNILAGCNATLSPPNLAFTLTVTDATNVSTSAPLLLNVRPNAPPALAYAPSNFVAFNEGGGSLPIYNASDDGQINSAILQSVTPAFAGQISVGLLARNPGSASIENARPSGNYTAIIRLTDNCGLTTDVPLNFTVGPAATPTVPRRTHTP